MTVMISRFFGLPQSLVRNGQFRRLTGAATKLYVVLWHESERTCERELTRTARQLIELMGGHRNSIAAGQKELVDAGLLTAEPFGEKGFVYELCDPDTGKPWPGPPSVAIPYVKKDSVAGGVPEADRRRKPRKARNRELAGTSFPFGVNVPQRQASEDGERVSKPSSTLGWDDIGR